MWASAREVDACGILMPNHPRTNLDRRATPVLTSFLLREQVNQSIRRYHRLPCDHDSLWADTSSMLWPISGMVILYRDLSLVDANVCQFYVEVLFTFSHSAEPGG